MKLLLASILLSCPAAAMAETPVSGGICYEAPNCQGNGTEGVSYYGCVGASWYSSAEGQCYTAFVPFGQNIGPASGASLQPAQ